MEKLNEITKLAENLEKEASELVGLTLPPRPYIRSKELFFDQQQEWAEEQELEERARWEEFGRMDK